jgi:hypothetical protein
MSKYRPFDVSPEAIAWRRENKKRIRPYVCKLPQRGWWLKPLVLWLGAAVMLALAL